MLPEHISDADDHREPDTPPQAAPGAGGIAPIQAGEQDADNQRGLETFAQADQECGLSDKMCVRNR